MILTQIIVVAVWSMFLVRVSPSAAIFYVVLAIYSIIPQVGYEYFPELSMAIGAYFGQGIITSYQIFFLTNLAIIPFALYLSSRITLSFGLKFRLQRFSGRLALRIFFSLYFGSMWLIFLENINSINYTISSASGGETFSVSIFPILNKFGLGLAVLVYAYRNLDKELRLISYIAVLSELFFAFKLGARVDIVCLFVGLALLHLGDRRLRGADIIYAILIMPFIFSFMIVVEAARNQVSFSETGLALQDLLAKDYFGPGHTVFGLIYYQHVEPLEQVVSNAVNSFPGLHRVFLDDFPLLSERVGSMISDGSIIISRTQGYAFHILGEGYVFMGMWGAVYNFLALLASFSFFQVYANSLSSRGKTIFIALVGTIIFPLIRSQFVYFPRFFIIYLLPIMFLHFLFFSNYRSRGRSYGT
tara:strand:- start:1409 stop:2656 length:1248 start_codon:yes stop_codon:yes gene_type:complete